MKRGQADRDGYRRRIDAVLREAKIVAPIHGMLLLRHVAPGETEAVPYRHSPADLTTMRRSC
jgi:hypothetical protein